jgi:hypothetical protein
MSLTAYLNGIATCILRLYYVLYHCNIIELARKGITATNIIVNRTQKFTGTEFMCALIYSCGLTGTVTIFCGKRRLLSTAALYSGGLILECQV